MHFFFSLSLLLFSSICVFSREFMVRNIKRHRHTPVQAFDYVIVIIQATVWHETTAEMYNEEQKKNTHIENFDDDDDDDDKKREKKTHEAEEPEKKVAQRMLAFYVYIFFLSLSLSPFRSS